MPHDIENRFLLGVENSLPKIGIKAPVFVSGLVNRIKSLSRKVLQEHKTKFGSSFAANKKALEGVAIISSKGLKNEIAGYITNLIKKEMAAEQERQERERLAADRLNAELSQESDSLEAHDQTSSVQELAEDRLDAQAQEGEVALSDHDESQTSDAAVDASAKPDELPGGPGGAVQQPAPS